MNYDLAKRLKDAGFPANWGLKGEESLMPFPTLSELIEACGADFWMLEKIVNWSARNNESTLRGSGSTPEEAVAELWLALNQK